MTKEKLRRVFIGVFLPEEIRGEIQKIQKDLQEKETFRGKYAELENLHLTLKFLGEINEEVITQVKDALKKLKLSKYSTKIDSAGIFTPNRPKIVWLHIGGLDELQKVVDNACETAGFKKEERFMGHITIARIKHITPISAKKLMEELGKINLGEEFITDKFALIESELTPEGPKYTVLKEYKLK